MRLNFPVFISVVLSFQYFFNKHNILYLLDLT